ncbi:MAG: DUF3662 domain-containing protein [Ardenticatenaceae bacterium]|nr:DUF3662 domain-containing protein [Ardenticatenaceae bacterium]MCB9443309.1 DUF3662 domain-containing protein [Ardenticatenaceae bacterium]
MKRKRPLTRFESLAQKLVEGSFKRLFGEQLEPYEIAARLAQMMEDFTLDGLAPNHFEVVLAETDRESLLGQYPALPAQLAGYLANLAQQADLKLPGVIQVIFRDDVALAPHQFYVRAEHAAPANEHTTQIQLRDDGQALAALRTLDAYLVIGGRRYVALDRPVFSIGRRTDNDIVLDSPTVSRKHAQIRWRYGRFILYDLSQRGRTAVNDQPVTEHVLQPGDVITLSDMRLIYGEEQATGPQNPPEIDEDGQTLPLPKYES